MLSAFLGIIDLLGLRRKIQSSTLFFENIKLSSKTLKPEIQPVVLGKNEFHYREKLLQITLSAKFGLRRYQSSEHTSQNAYQKNIQKENCPMRT